MEEVKETENKHVESEDLKKVPENGPYYQFGGFWRRLVASIIDGFIIFLFMIPFIVLFFVWMFSYFAGMNLESPENFSSAYGITSFIFLLIFMGIPFVYYWILMVKWQTTIGKKILGMKIVKMDGSKITLGTVFLRQLLGAWIASFIFNIGYLWIGYDIKKRSWADMVAGTYVVHYKELTKEEYKKQVNRDQHKDRFIVIVILWLMSPLLFIFLFGILAAAALVAINPLEKLNEAKQETCRMECSEDQTCIDECLAEFNYQTNSVTEINNDGWVTFDSPVETYSIDFPSKPETEVREESLGQGLPNLKLTSYFSENQNGVGYMAMSVSLPEVLVSTIDPQEFLKEFTSGITEGEDSKIISSSEVIFEGFPAVAYTIQIPEGYIKSVAFMIENNLYNLSVISSTNSFPEFDRFTKSFLFTAE